MTPSSENFNQIPKAHQPEDALPASTPLENPAEAIGDISALLPADHHPNRFDKDAKFAFNLQAQDILDRHSEGLTMRQSNELLTRLRTLSHQVFDGSTVPNTSITIGIQARDRYLDAIAKLKNFTPEQGSLLVAATAYTSSLLRQKLMLEPRFRRPETYSAFCAQVGNEGAEMFTQHLLQGHIIHLNKEYSMEENLDVPAAEYMNKLASKQVLSDTRMLVREKLPAADTLFLKDDAKNGDNDIDVTNDALASLHMLRQLVLISGKSSLYDQAIDKLATVSDRVLQAAGAEFSKICREYVLDPTDTTTMQRFLSSSQQVDMRRYVMGYEMRRVAEDLAFLKPIANELRGATIQHYADSMAEMLSSAYIDKTFIISALAMRDLGIDYTLPEPRDAAAPVEMIADTDGAWSDESSATIDVLEKTSAAEWPTALESRLTQLDWEVLPPGELQRQSVAIVEEFNERSGAAKAVVDLERLRILDNIRQQWGPDHSYYTRGHRKGRGLVRDESGLQQPDEYIILVLQETDRKGMVTNECAVAESPIAGPNALYVYRPDTTEHGLGWRAVMSLDKQSARKAGARNLRHRTRDGRDLVSDMTEKALILLTADPATFKHVEFAGLTAEGDIATRLNLGKTAVSGNIQLS